MTDQEEPSRVSPVLSDRLERLFEVQRPPQAPERRWSNREVVVACRAGGRELSESHLSELRRGVKKNPTVRTLQALAWFFQVREGYFTDPAVAAEVERELADREAALHARREESRQAEDELRSATAELQQAMRSSGVTRTAHRGVNDLGAAREQASMMRALARALTDEDDGETAGS